MLFLCFQTADVKMLVKCLQICARVFIDRSQNCVQTSFRSRAGLWPNIWSLTGKRLGHSHSKLCPILCRLRPKLCPNFGRSRARLCPIYFAPCPFPQPSWNSARECGVCGKSEDRCSKGRGAAPSETCLAGTLPVRVWVRAVACSLAVR